MNIKFFHRRISGIIISAICFFVFFSCASSNGATPNIKITKIVEKSESLNAIISYPVFADVPELNEKITAAIPDAFEQYKPQALKLWTTVNADRKPAEGKYPPLEYDVVTEQKNGQRYAFVLIRSYIYEGGAHGNTALTSFVYDKINHSFPTITDVSGKSLAEIADICRTQMTGTIRYGDGSEEAEKNRIDWIEKGTEPTDENYQAYTFDGKTLTIYFQQYQIAPYSFGIQKVHLAIN